ncbi:glycosyltransferase family 2 protein [Thermophilibacter immobilis]|uniref:Glycosyltransferase n=1 Tax=Thermophilibacter immobilis TaxID=2779519 RepID=A0A7S7M9H7_9ACTN|nr:glycosyltransferase [Thermophilibacter immobilis]QOY60353.1 glycosyltransferase [Thermophilibacter immobilis]
MRPDFCKARVGFVILAWNSEAVVRPCLESVLALDCTDLDVWVVDNGSTDSTPCILAELSSAHSNLHVVTSDKNLGTTISRNEALKEIESATDYICILDSGTVVNQAAFDQMVAVLVSNQKIGVVGPTMSSSDGSVQLSGRNLPTPSIKLGKAWPFGSVSKKAAKAEEPKTPIVNGIQDVGYLLSACWVLPKQVLDLVGLFDEKIFYAPEDVDWCVRCHAAGLRVVRCYEAHIVHEYQRLSHKKIMSKMNLEHIKGLVYYFWKNRYFSMAPEQIR